MYAVWQCCLVIKYCHIASHFSIWHTTCWLKCSALICQSVFYHWIHQKATQVRKNKCLTSLPDFLTALVIIVNSIGEYSKKEIGLYIKLGQYQIHSKKSRETKAQKPEVTGSKLFRQLIEKKGNRGTHTCKVSGQQLQKPSLCHSEGKKKCFPVVWEVKIYGGSSILKQRLTDGPSNSFEFCFLPITHTAKNSRCIYGT